jgi:deoxycytidine triphosphate deaminase
MLIRFEIADFYMIGFSKLLEMVNQQQLVEKLHANELTKKGGVSFDFRVGEIHEFAGPGFLGVNERKTPDTRILGKFEEGKSCKVTLEPNKYYIVKTIEKVNTPKELAWVVIPRSTLFRSGLLLLGGLGDPGFCGECVCGLINLNNSPFTIEMGSRIANIVFHKIDGEASAYTSSYHGGKLGTDKA